MTQNPGNELAASLAEHQRFGVMSDVSDPHVIRVCVFGEVDSYTGPNLFEHCDSHLARMPARTCLTVDLSSVTFLGVRGISILIQVANNARSKDIRFHLTGCTPWMLRLLTILGLRQPLDLVEA